MSTSEVASATNSAAGPPKNVVTGIIKAIRPKQWVKNLLVLAAPIAALGAEVPYDYDEMAINILIAFVSFSMAASCIYLVNDSRDVEADRQHPTKRFRPIAAGVVPEWLAYTIAVVLGLAALGISLIASPNLTVVIAVYIAMQLAYCFGLKHQAVLDICIVSSAYLIRAIAGGAAAGIPLSQWFLLVMTFGSLFMVAGKRYSELVQLGAAAGTRPSLANYSADYLRFARMLAEQGELRGLVGPRELPRLWTRHLANSAATVTRPDLAYDLVRPGLVSYGLSPIPDLRTSQDLGVRPAMTLVAPLSAVRRVPAGTVGAGPSARRRPRYSVSRTSRKRSGPHWARRNFRRALFRSRRKP